MKRKFFHPEPTQRELSGPQYWRSLDEVADTPAFREWLHQEFPSGAAELEGVDRRQFLKLMGASFAFAGVGLAGCRQPEQHILPYAKQPERLIPGVPVFYATSQPTPRDNVPLIAETHEARPTKLEGNPSYLPYGGGTNVFAQTSVLDLYDPDRAMHSVGKTGETLSRSQALDVLQSISQDYKARAGSGLAFLAEPSTSPSRLKLVQSLKAAFPHAIWAEYDPVNNDQAENALKALTGKRLRADYKFKTADRVLALESNFLQSEPGSLGYMRDFTSRRKVKDASHASDMNRLYAVESTFSITGGMADHRLRLAFNHLPAFTALMAAEVLEQTGASADEVAYFQAKGAALSVDKAWIKACATDLLAHAGRALVVVGADAPATVHQLALRINQALAAIGETVHYLEVPETEAVEIGLLADAIRLGQVKTLVIVGGNPAYNAPADLDWVSLQKSIPQVVRYGYHLDETSALGVTHIAANHYLESWGDGRTWNGTLVPVQPMILPLFEGMGELEFLGRIAQGGQSDAYGLVQETFRELALASKVNTTFDQWLAEGVLVGSSFRIALPAFSSADLRRELDKATFSPATFSASSIEVRILPSQQVWDGRYANNGWLQECPEPLTKLTWDNVILVGPALAKALQAQTGVPLIPEASVLSKQGQEHPQFNTFKQGKEEAFVGELTIDGRVISGPIHVHPGLADFTVLVTLGYGRTQVGRIGTGVGFDVYPIRTEANRASVSNASLKPTLGTYRLANTQQHWSMEGRAILREANADEYEAHSDFTKHMCLESHAPANLGPDKNKSFSEVVRNIPRGNSAYETPPFKGAQQWGMVIDLGSCTGCNACVVACQSENNVPIVGKDQVARGREMHWLRMDRYFSSGKGTAELPDDPQVAFMGMMCQHCEMAPCETVCPVNATVHDDQGLNVMAYNRCVGTRYCANNCPYKVRRFNFFDWNKREIGHFYEGPLGPEGMPELHKMQKNPNVTIRMRGVMEKCTYCVQRIESAKIRQLAVAKGSDNVNVPDGVIKSACQQVCPSEAITFGDVADPTSAVSVARSSDRAYAVLGYLNVRPRTMYLSRLRNPNPKMPDYSTQPLSRVEYESRYGHSAHAHEGASPAH